MVAVERYRKWVCPVCGHEVYSPEKPLPLRWADGHVCRFVPAENGQ